MDKEITEEYRGELEIKIKDIFIWALGEEAKTEMTKTVRDNDPNKMNINQLYSLFCLHFKQERNKFHNRAVFFGILQEPNETSEDVWTRIMQTGKIVNLALLHQPCLLHRSSYHRSEDQREKMNLSKTYGRAT